jgi:hypothetical protein
METGRIVACNVELLVNSMLTGQVLSVTGSTWTQDGPVTGYTARGFCVSIALCAGEGEFSVCLDTHDSQITVNLGHEGVVSVDERWIAIYRPIRGWAFCVYGPDGPCYTGLSYPTPQGAVQDATVESSNTGYRFCAPVIERCPLCKDWRLDGHCYECNSRWLLGTLEKAREQ